MLKDMFNLSTSSDGSILPDESPATTSTSFDVLYCIEVLCIEILEAFKHRDYI